MEKEDDAKIVSSSIRDARTVLLSNDLARDAFEARLQLKALSADDEDTARLRPSNDANVVQRPPAVTTAAAATAGRRLHSAYDASCSNDAASAAAATATAAAERSTSDPGTKSYALHEFEERLRIKAWSGSGPTNSNNEDFTNDNLHHAGRGTDTEDRRSSSPTTATTHRARNSAGGEGGDSPLSDESDTDGIGNSNIGCTIQVKAPANLPEGYTFDVSIAGTIVPVTVPRGGVTEGQYFDVPAEPQHVTVAEDVRVVPEEEPPPPPGMEQQQPVKTVITVTNPDGTQTITEKIGMTMGGAAIAPSSPRGSIGGVSSYPSEDAKRQSTVIMGRWRHSLWSCCRSSSYYSPPGGGSGGLFWMAWCCGPILLGQMLQRLHLTAFGCPTDGMRQNERRSSKTCRILLIAYAVTWFLVMAFAELTYGIMTALLVVFWVYTLIVQTRLRTSMRRQYRIPPDDCCGCCCGCPEGCMGDCCTNVWCKCCSLMQIARHTHDEDVYPYDCRSGTGLSLDTPDVV